MVLLLHDKTRNDPYKPIIPAFISLFRLFFKYPAQSFSGTKSDVANSFLIKIVVKRLDTIVPIIPLIRSLVKAKFCSSQHTKENNFCEIMLASHTFSEHYCIHTIFWNKICGRMGRHPQYYQAGFDWHVETMSRDLPKRLLHKSKP